MCRKDGCKKTLAWGINLVVSLVLTQSAIAQKAVLNGNVLSLPVVSIGSDAYQVELTLVDGSSPIELLVTSGVLLSDANTAGASTFDGVTLAVPSMDVDGMSYWANFDLLTADPPTFVFVDAGATVVDLLV
ncbi:MAG TPA: hypothetical protein QGF41_03580 [Gammaproteobacteria bacterium]|jgi:hypothetical protein|nr:hypothetical protein [Gammaproteobacteria bacterium]|tara:strand:+ start:33535 stop:33927 length:393 start_codon:yes stop_codon:yes gene_type:complete